MTDLKDLIEREIDQYLEWPKADRSHVTTVSAKLFAEHVATLYADHIPDAGKMVSPAVQGEPVAYISHTSEGDVLGWERQFDAPSHTPLYTAPQPAEQQPALTKYQPCGCVICTCEHETQCQGCGAKHCGTHPVGQIPGPVYQKPAPDVAGLVEALEIIEKGEDTGPDGWGAFRWADCRNIARAALAAHRKQGGEV